MKYPLRICTSKPAPVPLYISIVDANNSIVVNVVDDPNSMALAEHIVRTANRWHRWRAWFRSYTRDDWERERNPGPVERHMTKLAEDYVRERNPGPVARL
jgi:hypothetical protein